MQQSNKSQPSSVTAPQQSAPKRATIGFVFSVVSAIIILAQGIVRIFRGEAAALLASDEVRQRILAGLRLEIVGTIAIVFAVLILVGAYLIYITQTTTAGGIIVIIFAALSILTGGGWLIGLILGVIGGILGLLKK